MEKILAGYIRVSTEMQAERDSLPNQEERITSFAKARGKAFRIYMDRGISARDKERPALQRLISDIEDGKIDTVVVTKLDRITRSLKDLIYLKELFEKHNVAFISLAETIDSSTPMGRFSFYVLGLVAQLEREVTAERVAEDMKTRARRKKWNGGVIPYGFTSQARLYREWLQNEAERLSEEDGRPVNEIVRELERNQEARRKARAYASQLIPQAKRLFVDMKEAEVVRKIYELYLQLKSFRAVVHSLNTLGFRTRNGEHWSSTSVKRILQNPMYYGALTYNKRKSYGKTSRPRPEEEHIIVENVFEPIVSKDLYDEVQDIISSRRNKPYPRRNSPYLLSCLVKCGFCGSTMYGYTLHDHRKEGRIYKYYRCNGHVSKGSSVCQGNTIDMDTLNNLIVNELKSFKTDPGKLKERLKDYQIEYDRQTRPLLSQKKDIKQRLERIEKRVSRLFELYENELIDRWEFAERKASIEDEKRTLQRELEKVNSNLSASELKDFDLDSILNSFHSLADVYEELDFEGKRELIQTVISDITVRRHDIEYSIYAMPESVAVYDRTVARAATMVTPTIPAPAPPCRSRGIGPRSPAPS